jgi:hypothetical protein
MALLRKVFGPSREEIWRKLSSEIKGKYVEREFLKGDKVQATHGPWTVTLDLHVVSTGKVTLVFTRFRAPYVNPDGFRFRIYRRSSLSGLGKLFGMQDIEVGDPDFDEAFIIQGNDEEKVKNFFSKPRIRELVSVQPRIELAVKNDEGWFGPEFPEGVDELQFLALGGPKDVEGLKAVFDLFSEALDKLCRMGSAYETDPKVEL